VVPKIKKPTTMRATIAKTAMNKNKAIGEASSKAKRANTGPNRAANIENFSREIKRERIPFSLSTQVNSEAKKL
jgi:hypothetical protein